MVELCQKSVTVKIESKLPLFPESLVTNGQGQILQYLSNKMSLNQSYRFEYFRIKQIGPSIAAQTMSTEHTAQWPPSVRSPLSISEMRKYYKNKNAYIQYD